MVVRKRKKHSRFRGGRTYHGSHKKWRGGGSRGGRGRAGLHKHKWSYVVKYEPEAFGKRGFKRPPAVLRKTRVINLGRLEQMLPKLLAQKTVERSEGKVKVNLKKIGYEKLLGGGKISQPIIVEAKSFSPLAQKKLEATGGKVVKV